MVAVAAHEMGHALVIIRHGRSVRSAGFRLHLGTPSFYIDSVDAMLLPRRMRMVQAAAGPWAEWLVTSFVAVLAWAWAPPLALPLLYRFVLLNAATVLTNLLPFVGLDGSLILADLVKEPELPAALPRRCSTSGTKPWPLPATESGGCRPRVYAAANAVAAAALIVVSAFFWWELFGDAVEVMIGIGRIGQACVLAAAAVLVRPLEQPWPPASVGFVQSDSLAGRIRFRMERGRRVAAAKAVATIPELAGLSRHGLGVVAGQLRPYQLAPGRLLRESGFEGVAVVTAGRVRSEKGRLPPAAR